MRVPLFALALAVALAGCMADDQATSSSPEAPTATGTTTGPVSGPGDCGAGKFTRGAGDADRSLETLHVAFSANGTFEAYVPAPAAQDGTTVNDWLRNATVPAGWNVALGEAHQGLVLDVSGSGNGTLSSCAVQVAEGANCCAEAYLQARWGDKPPRSENITVQVLRGSLGLSVRYQAQSDLCGTTASFSAAGLAVGLHEVPGRSQAVCA